VLLIEEEIETCVESRHTSPIRILYNSVKFQMSTLINTLIPAVYTITVETILSTLSRNSKHYTNAL
jgi:hypothetical protein